MVRLEQLPRLWRRSGNGVPCGPTHPCGLLLQWHVTERCNLHCAHCYQEACGEDELDLAALLRVLDLCDELLERRTVDSGRRRVPAQITLTGGEPFARPDVEDLLAAIAARRRRWRLAVLTNGTLLNRARVRRLRRLRPVFVQVSIEGTPQTHDRLRGPGSHERAVAGARRLVRAGIPTFLAFTAHRENAHEFEAVARLGRRLGVHKVWADRLIPCGAGAAMRTALLDPAETRAFFESMEKARAEAARDPRSSTRIAMHRALQFLVGGGSAYRCSAGDSLLTLLPNGDLVPCRRMPVVIGNVRDRSLAELYCESELLQQLRAPDRVADGCEGCVYRRVCGGGLRCLSHAVTGSPFNADPGCWRARRTEAS